MIESSYWDEYDAVMALYRKRYPKQHEELARLSNRSLAGLEPGIPPALYQKLKKECGY